MRRGGAWSAWVSGGEVFVVENKWRAGSATREKAVAALRQRLKLEAANLRSQLADVEHDISVAAAWTPQP